MARQSKGKSKQIRRQKASGGKRIKAPADTSNSTETKHPVFCFRHLQNGFDIEDGSDDSQRQLVKKLRQLSRLDWIDIQHAPRHGAGTEKIPLGRINAPLPPFLTEDVNLLALRFDGKKPMVGYRSGAIFHILWLDHNFKLYDHGS